MVKQFEHDAVGIGWNVKNYALQVTHVDLADRKRPETHYQKLREKRGAMYRSPIGRKYAVLFYEVEDKGLIITDFFRCVLVDPDFYVRQQLKNGILALAVDEFSLCEKWLSNARKKTDFGVYSRIGQFLAQMWQTKDVGDQLSKERFEQITMVVDKSTEVR